MASSESGDQACACVHNFTMIEIHEIEKCVHMTLHIKCIECVSQFCLWIDCDEIEQMFYPIEAHFTVNDILV